jgi:hypothetical protein
VYTAVATSPALCDEAAMTDARRKLAEEFAKDALPVGHHIRDEL